MLRRITRQTQKSGKYTHCIVEDVNFGYATVRLGTVKGPRMTSLPVVGGTVRAGERALVDYSGGTPIVRPGAFTLEEAVLDLAEEEEEEATVTVSPNTGFYIYGTSLDHIGANETVEVPLQTWKWCDGDFEQVDNGILIPYVGFFAFIAHFAVIGFEKQYVEDECWDWTEIDEAFMGVRNPVQVWLEGSTVGVFAYNDFYAIDTDPSVPTIVQVNGFLGCPGNEVVTMKARYARTWAVPSLTVLSEGQLHPRIMCHWLSSGKSTTQHIQAGAIISTPEGPGYEVDDSDIEIRDDQGYLHFEDKSEAFARAIAQMGEVSNAEITLDYKFEDVGHGGDFRVFLRTTRDWDTWNSPASGYEFSHRNTGSYSLTRIQSGVRTVIDDGNYSATVLPLKLRFRCNGNYIRARVWLASESEPGTWNLDVNDTGGFTTAGAMQLGYFRTEGEHKMYIDNLSVHAPT